MKTTVRAVAIAGAFLALGAATNAAQVAPASGPLPPQVRAALTARYPGWQLLRAAAICDEPNNGSSSIVSGDFNGDGRQDYAVRLTQRARAHIVAAVSNGAQHALSVLATGTREEISENILRLERRGTRIERYSEGMSRSSVTRLRNDAIGSGICESSGWVYVHENGRFRTVSTGD